MEKKNKRTDTLEEERKGGKFASPNMKILQDYTNEKKGSNSSGIDEQNSGIEFRA